MIVTSVFSVLRKINAFKKKTIRSLLQNLGEHFSIRSVYTCGSYHWRASEECMKKSWYIVSSLLIGPMMVSPTLWAASNIDNISSLNQNLFKDLTNDLGTALSYKALTPNEPLGGLGFDVDFDISSTSLESSALDQATTGDTPDQLLIPKVRFHSDLPLGFDVSAFYGSVPDSNIGLIGGELRYAIYDGNSHAPAIAIRGTFSQLSGVDQLDLNTRGLELSVSKGFAAFTPYAGISTMRIKSDTNVLGLKGEDVTENKYFLGFNLNLGQMNITAEAEKTGDEASTSAKIGVRF